ncbi:hypothetical protein ACP4OV_005609 [Aristida adscensionis]
MSSAGSSVLATFACLVLGPSHFVLPLEWMNHGLDFVAGQGQVLGSISVSQASNRPREGEGREEGLLPAWPEVRSSGGEWEPLRIFYESLSKQIPSSEMAEFWTELMEHGMLSPERAKKAYEKKQKRQQQARLGTPVKSSITKDKPESSKKPIISTKKPIAASNIVAKVKKRVDYSDDDDDDFIVKMKRSKG